MQSTTQAVRAIAVVSFQLHKHICLKYLTGTLIILGVVSLTRKFWDMNAPLLHYQKITLPSAKTKCQSSLLPTTLTIIFALWTEITRFTEWEWQFQSLTENFRRESQKRYYALYGSNFTLFMVTTSCTSSSCSLFWYIDGKPDNNSLSSLNI